MRWAWQLVDEGLLHCTEQVPSPCFQARRSRRSKCQEKRCLGEEKELREETTECLHVVHERDEAKGDSRVHTEGVLGHQPDSWSEGESVFDCWLTPGVGLFSGSQAENGAHLLKKKMEKKKGFRIFGGGWEEAFYHEFRINHQYSISIRLGSSNIPNFWCEAY